MGSLLKIFERFLILKMLRVKWINYVNVEELIYSGGIILGNIYLFIFNKWNLVFYMYM